jgi:methyl-accepting chemotaxis protein
MKIARQARARSARLRPFQIWPAPSSLEAFQRGIAPMASHSSSLFSSLRDWFAGNLSRASISLFVTIALIDLSFSAYALLAIRQEAEASAAQEQKSAKADRLFSQLVEMRQAAKYDIAQARLSLFDFLGSRDQQGLENAFRDFGSHSKDFSLHLRAAVEAAKVLESPDLVRALAQAEKSIVALSAKAVESAKSGNAGGPADGNLKFTQLALSVQMALDNTKAEVDALRKRIESGKAAAALTLDGLRSHAQLAALLAMAVVAATSGLAFWQARRWVAQPLDWITFTFSRLVEGDLNYDVYEAGRTDEIGRLGVTYRKFRLIAKERLEAQSKTAEQQAIIEAERARSDAERAAVAAEQESFIEALGAGLARLADCDLSFRLTQGVPAAYRRLQEDFNAALEKLEAALTQVRDGAGVISSSTSEIASAADDLSRRTEQQAASLEETAAALQEIMTAVNKNADFAKRAQGIVEVARSEAESSGAIVQKATGAMSRIEKSSNDIASIIGLIDEISFQTNLLALNAGVEAARAGEAGRGFAVVASEVRGLAQRSAEAAKEIKTLILSSKAEVADGVRLVNSTGEALERIVSEVMSISSMVSEIAAGAVEEAAAIKQINIAVGQMDHDTQKNAAMVEETTAASHSLRQEALELTRSVGNFNLPKQENVIAARDKFRREFAVAGGAAPKLDPEGDELDWEEF